MDNAFTEGHCLHVGQLRLRDRESVCGRVHEPRSPQRSPVDPTTTKEGRKRKEPKPVSNASLHCVPSPSPPHTHFFSSSPVLTPRSTTWLDTGPMFGELVCGPPGSGKTTYCEGKRQFLSVYDPTRPVTLINLDPANEEVFPYPCDVDIRDLVDLRTVMEQQQLGPNGSYLFCADVMERNVDWVVQQVELAVERRVREVMASMPPAAAHSDTPPVRAPYLLLDCPGQVEFYLNSSALHRVFKALEKQLQCSVCTVHLVDAGIATRDIPTYISSCTLALTTMIDHELPHMNVLTKWDTVQNMHDNALAGVDAAAPFLNSSNFLEEDFDRLWRSHLRRRRRERRLAEAFVTSTQPNPRLDPEDVKADSAIDTLDLAKEGGRMYAFSRALLEVVDGFGLVGFHPLDVQSQAMMLDLTRDIDNAIGNFF